MTGYQMLDKKKILEMILEQLKQERGILMEAAQATYEAATHEENKPENEYDTRALEASYLAGAQAKRIGDIDEALSLLKNFTLKDFTANDPISASALVKVELNEKVSFLFLLPKGGGHILQLDGRSLQVVSANSPLGAALIGLKVGEIAVVENGKNSREYEILSVQ